MILTSEKIKEEIIKKYNSKPTNWRMVFGKDNHGHYNTAIAHDSESWLIKEEQINPYKSVGYGTKIAIDTGLLDGISPYTFGLRPLSEKLMRELLMTVNHDNNKFREIFSNIMNSRPVPLDKLDSTIALRGPVVSSGHSMQLISRKHKELDSKLRKDLKKMLYKKYPQTITPYS